MRSILVGNGLTVSQTQTKSRSSPFMTDFDALPPFYSMFPFWYGHGIFSTKTNDALNKYCLADPNGQDCQKLMNDVFTLTLDINVS